MIAVMVAGAISMIVSLFGTRYLITFFRNRGQGPADPRQGGPRSRAPPAQAGDADDGWSGDRRLRLLRLDGRPLPARSGLLQPGGHRLGRHPRAVGHGLPRRLHQGQQGAQPRHLLEEEELHHPGHLDGHRLVARGCHGDQQDHLVHPATTGPVGTCRGRSGWCSPASPSGAPPTPSTSPMASTVSPRGAGLLGFLAFTIIAYWAFRNPGIYGGIERGVVNPLDLAALAAAFAGACGGFLWFNAAPARIIMGDVGALAIGTALGTARSGHRHPDPADPDLWHQRHRGRFGGRPDGRVQGLRAQTRGCSGCRRSITTSSCSAGRRPR